MIRPTDIFRRLDDRPFKPFRIHMSDGTQIDVLEPGMIMVGTTTAVLPYKYTRDEEGHFVADTFRTIAFVHIVQFSDLDEKVNGHRRKRKK